MNFLSGFKTHITGFVGLLVAAAVGFGWISPETQGEIATATIQFLELAVAAIIALQSLIGIFTRMGIKKEAQKVASKAALFICIVFFSSFTLTGCGDKTRLVNADGKPIEDIPLPKICYMTAQGELCLDPNKKPPPAPPPAPPALAPGLPLAKSYVKPLEK